MLSIIWRALLFFVTFWFAQRFLGSLFGTGKGQRQARKAQDPGTTKSNQMVRDPVCGMYLDHRLAIALEDKGGKFYFCSKECRSKYLANTV
jgi:YHS domain-containing protein